MKSVSIRDHGPYHAGMDDGLPHPSEGLTLQEIAKDPQRVLRILKDGGAVLVYDDGYLLGVLTRQQPLLDEASIAAMIDTGHLPPLDELAATSDRRELS